MSTLLELTTLDKISDASSELKEYLAALGFSLNQLIGEDYFALWNVIYNAAHNEGFFAVGAALSPEEIEEWVSRSLAEIIPDKGDGKLLSLYKNRFMQGVAEKYFSFFPSEDNDIRCQSEEAFGKAEDIEWQEEALIAQEQATWDTSSDDFSPRYILRQAFEALERNTLLTVLAYKEASEDTAKKMKATDTKSSIAVRFVEEDLREQNEHWANDTLKILRRDDVATRKLSLLQGSVERKSIREAAEEMYPRLAEEKRMDGSRLVKTVKM